MCPCLAERSSKRSWSSSTGPEKNKAEKQAGEGSGGGNYQLD